MIKFVADDALWKVIERLSKKGPNRIAAIAYVTTDTPVSFGRGDELVVDASDRAIRNGDTSASVLERAFKAGARLYSDSTLHTKVLLFSGVAVVGSQNMSRYSQRVLRDAALITDYQPVISQVYAYIHRLIENGTPIDEPFIRHIKSIRIRQAWNGRAKGTAKRIPFFAPTKHQTWVIAQTIDERDRPDEKGAAKKGWEEAERKLQELKLAGHIEQNRWGSNDNFKRKAQIGDTVIELWQPAIYGAATRAYLPETIVNKREVGHATYLYMACPSRGISIKGFRKLLKLAGLPRNIAKSIARRLTPRQADALFSQWSAKYRKH